MSATATSRPNIAFIKYWGNRNNELRLPAADSVSMTLDHPAVEVTVEHADTFSLRSFERNGVEKVLKEKDIKRFQKHLELTKRYLQKLGIADAIPANVAITVRSAIPPAIGLASSAAVFSALAKAYTGLIAGDRELSLRETSIIARFGAGSAARSIFGGFSALLAGKGEAIDAAYGEQIAPESHWSLCDIVIVPDQEEKKVGSTEGHELAPTSPFFAARIDAIRARRQQECIDAVLTRDFEKLQKVSEEDALDMHHVMETSVPPIKYLTEDTYHIIDAVTELRRSEHLPVLYTMDAGPTVHLICTEEARDRIAEFAHLQANSTVFETHVGPEARTLSLVS